MSISLIKLQLQYIELEFKSEYLIRTCSVATDLMTSHQFHSNLCFYAVPFLANYGTIPYSLFFTPIAALLQAVLQTKTEAFRNGLVETRNWTLKTSRNHRTGPNWSEVLLKHGLGEWNTKFVLFPVIRWIIIIFQYWKSVWFFVSNNIYCVGAGKSNLMSTSDGLGSYFFRRKMGSR